MGDMGEVFRVHNALRKERGERNLAKASLDGFEQCTPYHYHRVLLGDRLDYWPSRNKWMWRGKVMTGNVREFIEKREKTGEEQ